MRIIAEIPHPRIKITLFYMNQKYLVKFEKGHLEQVYKFSELDYIIPDVETVKAQFTNELIDKVELEFERMLAIHAEASKKL